MRRFSDSDRHGILLIDSFDRYKSMMIPKIIHYCWFGKNPLPSDVVKYIATKEAEKWNRNRLEKCVDYFICPSFFMKKKMEQGGFSSEKLEVLHNFINPDKLKATDIHEKDDFYCYVGRLSEEKGVLTLLTTASQLPFKLNVLGTGPLESEFQKKFSQYKNIEFMGHCDWNTCKNILSRSKCSVIPSEWYESNPLSVIESLCLGTPVLGADIGGIPELIGPGITGPLFKSADIDELKIKIKDFFEHPVSMPPIDRKIYSSLQYEKK